MAISTTLQRLFFLAAVALAAIVAVDATQVMHRPAAYESGTTPPLVPLYSPQSIQDCRTHRDVFERAFSRQSSVCSLVVHIMLSRSRHHLGTSTISSPPTGDEARRDPPHTEILASLRPNALAQAVQSCDTVSGQSPRGQTRNLYHSLGLELSDGLYPGACPVPLGPRSFDLALINVHP